MNSQNNNKIIDIIAKISQVFFEDISQTISNLTNSRNEQVRCFFSSIVEISQVFFEDISQTISNLKNSRSKQVRYFFSSLATLANQFRFFLASLPNFPANLFRFFGSVVLLSLIFFSGITYFLFGVDHYFKLEKSNIEITNNYNNDFIQAIGKRLCPEDFKKDTFDPNQYCHSPQSLVLVAASGGGIQASGWTAQVLAGLQGEIGEKFTKSIALISSVSGGSVGTMFYLDKIEEGVLDDDPKDKHSLFENATEDWLASVGWGLAYPDLFRIIGLPWVLDLLHGKNAKYLDRGYALEKDWQEHLSGQITLDDWYKKIKNGEIPIPVFNATLVENGRRFLISPMKFIEGNMPDYFGENSEKITNSKALDLKTLFNCGSPDKIQQCNLNVTTAARLSASFPYVSPLPRNYIEIEKKDKTENKKNEKDNKFQVEYKDSQNKKTVDSVMQNYHIADGGYFDNSGTFTVIEWLDNFLNWNSEGNNRNILNIKKVVIVDIDAFPQEQLKDNEPGKLGFINVASGPFDALDGVRDATQIARNLRSLELLEDKWINKKIKIEDFTFEFPRKKENKKGTTSDYCNIILPSKDNARLSHPLQKANVQNGDASEEEYTQPLSWRLTKEQKDNLKKAWCNSTQIEKTLKRLKTFWQLKYG